MNFEYYCLTDTGLVRDNNEDSVALDTETQVAVLADGMGGYNAGEVASAMATSFIKTELGRWITEGGFESSPRELRRAMEVCVDNANRSIFNAANAHAGYAGMGTTLVMGVFQDGRAMIGHVGDSRCYRLRRGARPLAAAGAARRRLHHPAAGGRVIPQESGDAGARGRGQRAARGDRTPHRPW